MTDTPTPEEMQARVEEIRRELTPEALCRDIHSAAIDRTIGGMDAVIELFKSKGRDDSHPSIVSVRDQIESLKASKSGARASLSAAFDVDAETLAAILKKHGHTAASPENAHPMVHAMPPCWQEALPQLESQMILMGIQRIKDKLRDAGRE